MAFTLGDEIQFNRLFKHTTQINVQLVAYITHINTNLTTSFVIV